MSLDHILLGMLRQPSTGYELGNEFAGSAQLFWFAERSQIYPALKRMRDRGWLDTWEEPSQRGPRRKLYQTTAEGRDELRAWLRDGPHIGKERLAFAAQAFFLGELDDFSESLGIVRKMRAIWEHRLTQLEFVERMIFEEYGEASRMHADGLHQHATMRMGVHAARARIAWCDETIERLETRIAADKLEPVGMEG